PGVPAGQRASKRKHLLGELIAGAQIALLVVAAQENAFAFSAMRRGAETLSLGTAHACTTAHESARRGPPRGAQSRSSGAMVRPSSRSCSQYSSACSRCPVQTI